MADLASYLARVGNTVVTHAAGIEGNYSFTARYTHDGADGDSAWPPLLAAVQEQLRLKLAVHPSTLTVLRVVRLAHPSLN